MEMSIPLLLITEPEIKIPFSGKPEPQPPHLYLLGESSLILSVLIKAAPAHIVDPKLLLKYLLHGGIKAQKYLERE